MELQYGRDSRIFRVGDVIRHLHTIMMTPRYPLYCRDVTPFLTLRELLLVPAPPADPDGRALPTHYVRIPSPGHSFKHIIQGVPVIVQHSIHGLHLIINNTTAYQIVARPVPRLKWHTQSKPSQFQEQRTLKSGDLASRFPVPPATYLILDTLGHRVRSLFLHIPSRCIGSAHEIKHHKRNWIYRSLNTPKHARTERNLTKLFARFPERRADVLNPKNSIAKLMTPSHRPFDIRDRTWMRLILAARHGLSGEKLENETTAALAAWRSSKKPRGNPRGSVVLAPNRSRSNQQNAGFRVGAGK
jgi:hypothetical protein